MNMLNIYYIYSNSEKCLQDYPFALELLENLEEIFSHY